MRPAQYSKAIELLTIDRTKRLEKQLAEKDITIDIKLAQKDREIERLKSEWNLHQKAMEQHQKEVEEILKSLTP